MHYHISASPSFILYLYLSIIFLSFDYLSIIYCGHHHHTPGRAFTIPSDTIGAVFFPSIVLQDSELMANFGEHPFKFDPCLPGEMMCTDNESDDDCSGDDDSSDDESDDDDDDCSGDNGDDDDDDRSDDD